MRDWNTVPITPASRRYSQMLDERMRITQSGDDRQLAIAGRDGERRNPDGTACTTKCKMASPTAARPVVSASVRVNRRGPRRAPTAHGRSSRPLSSRASFTRSCADPVQSPSNRRITGARRGGQADERPVVIVRVPQIDAMTERQTHAIERVAAAIREMRQRGRGSGFDGHHPGALVLAGDRGFVSRTWPISVTTCPRN